MQLTENSAMTRKLLTGGLAALLLAACGGDGNFISRQTPPDTAEGLWSGIASVSSDPVPDTRQFNALVTADGQVWMAYSQAGLTTLGGLVQGPGSSDAGAGTYSAPAVTERTPGVALAGALAASYLPQDRFGGTVTSNPGVVRTLTFNPAYSANYDTSYEQLAGLPAGNTPVTATGLVSTGTVEVDAALDPGAGDPAEVLVGRIGPVGTPCFFTSPATAAAGGNYFNVSLTFIASAACTGYGLAAPLGGVLFRSPAGKYVLVADGADFGFVEN